MPSVFELTLGELARVALGTPDLGPNNIAALYSLIDLLLKKLDCRNEIVKISGFESISLREMLQSSKIVPFTFQEDNLVILSQKFNRIAELEKRLETLQNRLKEHFKEISACNKDEFGGIFEYRNWEPYTGSCEDTCVVSEPENLLGAQLLINTDFMKKMLRRVSYPLVNRMLEFENKVETLHENFGKFTEKTRQHYMKMSLVERCVDEIERLRHKIGDHHAQFISAMEEVQDMLDSKLDKSHFPALKKYVRERFDSIEHTLKVIDPTKTKAANMIMDGLTCLSCGNMKVCAEKTIRTKDFTSTIYMNKNKNDFQKYCNCRTDKTSSAAVGMVNLRSTNAQPKPCKEQEYILKEGKNKIMYRMILEKECKDQQDVKREHKQ